ncbi:hypothetical protein [Pseudomonas sp. URMO17WK12:I4]|uniref:hypothetical protein n=1 Tax=Pseudomonas sp. URMO17WK12:I4 TaxID=1283292 RepID=UPI00048032CE|nr:hypothetical protein [Pseudomonas sp. URMO17WK12:I4]
MTLNSSASEGTDSKVVELPKSDAPSAESDVRYSLGSYSRSLFDEDRYQKEQLERRKRMYLTVTFMFAFFILFAASVTNPDIYKIDPQTLSIINQAFNAVVLLVIPFLLGSVGAIARILISGVHMGQSGGLIVSSGLMAMFSWVGIKSGVLLAIVAPHIEKQAISSDVVLQSPNDFYTMALVAILVGMFSTNLYIFIKQRVEQLTQQEKNAEAEKEKSSQTQ